MRLRVCKEVWKKGIKEIRCLVDQIPAFFSSSGPHLENWRYTIFLFTVMLCASFCSVYWIIRKFEKFWERKWGKNDEKNQHEREEKRRERERIAMKESDNGSERKEKEREREKMPKKRSGKIKRERDLPPRINDELCVPQATISEKNVLRQSSSGEELVPFMR